MSRTSSGILVCRLRRRRTSLLVRLTTFTLLSPGHTVFRFKVWTGDLNCIVLGLIPLIRKALLKSHEKGRTERAWLCCDRAVHVESEHWDKGWGCGYAIISFFLFCAREPYHSQILHDRYRNFLMLCAVLMSQTRQPHYRELLKETPAPGLRNLQVVIESAWELGIRFDSSQIYSKSENAEKLCSYPGFDKDGARQLEHLAGTKKWIGTAGQ